MLFTIGNPKTAKGEARGYLTAVLHLAPHESAGVGNMCPRATAGCIATCLNTAGRGGIFKAGATTNAVQEARKRRTVQYKADRIGFIRQLTRDVAKLQRMAERKGMTLTIRVNGTSDDRKLALHMCALFPSVQFYDYTKIAPTRWSDWQAYPANYHLTFSRSERNETEVRSALAAGVNVAVAFSTKRGKALPTEYLGRLVIDGDATDLRFRDVQGGVIVGLRAKGKARKDTSGFVVQVGG